jgi:hypothetical protein
MVLMFGVCAFPVHVWAIVNLLRELPAWLLRLSIWELIGVISYVLVFALVESVAFLVALLVLAALLPAKLLRDRFVAVGTMLVVITTAWAIAAHYNADAIRLWGLRQFALWGALYLVSVLVGWALVYRFKRLQGIVVAVAERLVVLSAAYVVLDLLGVGIVVLRNVIGVLA